MFNDIDDLNPENKKKINRHNDLMEQLKDIEENTNYNILPNGSFLPSSLLKDKNKEEPTKQKKEKSEVDEFLESDDDWFNTIMEMKVRKPRNNKGKDLFAEIGPKKKKKKKKDKNPLTDYNKEFETEINLYRNLLQDQNRFTESLQREYDARKSTKSSARGVDKNLNDLIENITSARSLAMQLVEKNVAVKKTISELTLKEKKEFGSGNAEDNSSNDFAAKYLNQIMNERNRVINPTGTADVSDYSSEEDLFETLSENLGDNNRPSDVEKYLKYEQQNITVYVSIDSNNTDDYFYLARNEEGNIIEDYPLPIHSSLSINRSTNIATDSYGKKYPIEWR